jgi:hypothetical protein
MCSKVGLKLHANPASLGIILQNRNRKFWCEFSLKESQIDIYFEDI